MSSIRKKCVCFKLPLPAVDGSTTNGKNLVVFVLANNNGTKDKEKQNEEKMHKASQIKETDHTEMKNNIQKHNKAKENMQSALKRQDARQMVIQKEVHRNRYWVNPRKETYHNAD
ncbi:hypothetical protein HAX54_011193 [Datura stramonium]|uniref:Uncharacterized protein n=1 Tax=Datura stramonium TaxID=4076 RepID=A0ABS8TK76_DATST|nr:hypothetical protein [Datura stramonium]